MLKIKNRKGEKSFSQHRMHRSRTVYKRKQFRTGLNKYVVGFWCERLNRGRGWTFSLEELLLWIMDSYFDQKWWFKVKNLSMMILFITIFSLHKTFIYESCGLLVDDRDVFISCLDSHSDGTHSLQRMLTKWCNDKFLQIYSDEETNSSTSWMAWRWVHFSPLYGDIITLLGDMTEKKKKTHANLLCGKKVGGGECLYFTKSIGSLRVAIDMLL